MSRTRVHLRGLRHTESAAKTLSIILSINANGTWTTANNAADEAPVGSPIEWITTNALDVLTRVSSESDSAALAPLRQEFRRMTRTESIIGPWSPTRSVQEAYVKAGRAFGRSGSRVRRGRTDWIALQVRALSVDRPARGGLLAAG